MIQDLGPIFGREGCGDVTQSVIEEEAAVGAEEDAVLAPTQRRVGKIFTQQASALGAH